MRCYGWISFWNKSKIIRNVIAIFEKVCGKGEKVVYFNSLCNSYIRCDVKA